MHEVLYTKRPSKANSIQLAGVHGEMINRMFAELILDEVGMVDGRYYGIFIEVRAHVDS